jgi:uncharacterized protein (DUF885 family)
MPFPRHVLKLGSLLLLVSCATIDSKREPASDQVTRRAASIVDQFENRLAEKLLRVAAGDIQAANADERFQVIDDHRRRMNQSLDIAKLSVSNRHQLRLFEYLWQTESTGRDYATSEEFSTIAGPGLDPARVSAQAFEKLSKLHARIRLVSEIPEQASLKPLFRSVRNNPENYLANNDAGRQNYLDLIVASLLKVERLLPALYRVKNDELTLEGVVDSEDRPVFSYNKGSDTLSINLYDMHQLPLYEVASIASYYGVPGMHAISSVSTSEIQTMISVPGYMAGWASYITSSLNHRPPFQHPDTDLESTYFETMVISLAIADIGLDALGWSVEQATQFAVDNSPYPATRMRKSVQLASRIPGTFSTPLLARLEFEKLQDESSEILQQDFNLGEFHALILRSGFQPFTELQKVVTNWTNRVSSSGRTSNQDYQ